MNLGVRSRAGLVKAVGEEVTLTWATWEAPRPPAPGDGLVTPTGRRYLIRAVAGRRLKCVVLPAKPAPVTIPGTWFSWWWNSRRKR